MISDSYSRNEKQLSKSVILITLFFLYIFPMSIHYIKDVFNYNKMLFNVVVVLIYLFYAYKQHIKIQFIDIVIVLFMIIRFYFTRDLESFGLVYLLLIPHLNFKDISLKDHRIIFYLLIASVFFYTWLHRRAGFPQRISTSSGEVNEVGFALIMLFFILKLNRQKVLSYLIIGLGLMTLSRNYFLAIAIYVVVEIIFKFLKKRGYRLSFPVSFEFYASLSIIFVVALYFMFLALSEVIEFRPYYMDFNRFLTFFDPSNYNRFVANIAVFIFFANNPMKLLTGIPYEVYTNYFSRFPLQGYKYSTSIISPPHNFFFKFLYKYGLFSLVIFKITADAINKRLHINNLAIFLSFLMYATFLGTGFYEGYLFIFLYLLDGSIRSKELSRNNSYREVIANEN